jgi:hypothetical protein
MQRKRGSAKAKDMWSLYARVSCAGASISSRYICIIQRSYVLNQSRTHAHTDRSLFALQQCKHLEEKMHCTHLSLSLSAPKNVLEYTAPIVSDWHTNFMLLCCEIARLFNCKQATWCVCARSSLAANPFSVDATLDAFFTCARLKFRCAFWWLSLLSLVCDALALSIHAPNHAFV